MNLFRPLLGLVAVAAVFAMLAGDADARQRGSVGSRGSKTYSAPASTATAPNTAAPINRSMTQPGAATSTAARPPVQQPGGMFGGMRGILGGLALGFLGAGLFGMLTGGGFLSGLAGFASILGFLAQIALIAGVVFLAYRWWQRRSQPQPSYAGMPRQMTPRSSSRAPRSAIRWLRRQRRACHRAARGQGRGFRHVRAPARRSADCVRTRRSRRAALKRDAGNALLLCGGLLREREPRRDQRDQRREAVAGRSRQNPGAKTARSMRR